MWDCHTIPHSSSRPACAICRDSTLVTRRSRSGPSSATSATMRTSTCCSSRRDPAVSQQAARRASEGVVRRRAAAGEVALPVAGDQRFHPGYLRRRCGQETAAALRPEGAGLEEQAGAELDFCRWVNDLFMPIEFSAAAHRLGHSLVRPVSRLNTRLKGADDPAQAVRKLFALYLFCT